MAFSASSQSLFGNPSQSQPSLFSNPSSQPSLFGNTSSQPSLFGNPSSQPSLFGNPSSQSSLFPSQPPQQSPPSFFNSQPASQPSLFASQSSLFSSQPSLFPPQNPFSQNAPVSGANLALTASNAQQAFAQQQQLQQQNMLPSPMLQLMESLNPLHPSSPFQAALYNVVPTNVLPRYTKPPTMHPSLWQAALSANPDPSRQVPVPANGFEDLHKRTQMQSARVNDHIAVLTRLQSDVDTIQQSMASQLTTKLAAYRRHHRELARKLLRVASVIELAAARADSSPTLSAVETDRHKRLEAIAQKITAPAEFKDKLSDLVEISSATISDRSLTTPVIMRDSRAANAIRQLLSDQLNGIQHLSNVSSKIDRDVSIMSNML